MSEKLLAYSGERIGELREKDVVKQKVFLLGIYPQNSGPGSHARFLAA